MDIELIVRLYTKEKESIGVIAEKFNTYPNKIRRLLKKAGITMRDKSEAQSLALSSGRREHPTKDKGHSEETKKKIGQKAYNWWQNISDENYEKHLTKARDRWNNMSESERKAIQASANEAIRLAGKEGSKLEKFIFGKLVEEKYNVIYHKKHLIMNGNMELDLLIPELKTVIEIDGPTHYLPIWGEENLKKHIAADTEKNGMLITSGFVVIRLKNLAKHASEIRYQNIFNELLVTLKSIESEFPKQENRLIYLTLGDN